MTNDPNKIPQSDENEIKRVFSISGKIIIGIIILGIFISIIRPKSEEEKIKQEESRTTDIALVKCQGYLKSRFTDKLPKEIAKLITISFPKHFRIRTKQKDGRTVMVNIVQEVWLNDNLGNVEKERYDCHIERLLDKGDWFVSEFAFIDSSGRDTVIFTGAHRRNNN